MLKDHPGVIADLLDDLLGAYSGTCRSPHHRTLGQRRSRSANGPGRFR